MTGKYRAGTNPHKSRFFILLSVVFIFVVIKWGFPWFISMISGAPVAKNTQGQADIIPPQVPVLLASPEATNSSSFTIEGFTEASSKVELYFNEDPGVTSKSDIDGKFKFLVKLISGENKYLLKAIDDANNSSQSTLKTISFDSKPVDFNLISPADGTEFFGKANQVVSVIGKSNKTNVTVLVNNSFTDVDKEGTFTYKFQMAEGENKVKIVITDKAGNSVQKEITLKYSK